MANTEAHTAFIVYGTEFLGEGAVDPLLDALHSERVNAYEHTPEGWGNDSDFANRRRVFRLGDVVDAFDVVTGTGTSNTTLITTGRRAFRLARSVVEEGSEGVGSIVAFSPEITGTDIPKVEEMLAATGTALLLFEPNRQTPWVEPVYVVKGAEGLRVPVASGISQPGRAMGEMLKNSGAVIDVVAFTRRPRPRRVPRTR